MNGLKRFFVIGVLVASLGAGSTVPALADQGGTPNAHACQGQVISALAEQGITEATFRAAHPGADPLPQIVKQACQSAGGDPGGAMTIAVVIITAIP